MSHSIYLKPYYYLPVLLETQSPHYSAFLVKKSVKKANFPPFQSLNQAYILSSELSDLPKAIPLLTCAFGIPHYSAFLVIKSVKKSNFPLFESLNQAYILSSELSNPPEAIPLLTCAFGDPDPPLFRYFGHKIGQKSEFPSF